MTTTLTPTDLHRTFLAMERHGGRFCASIAQTWRVADPTNKRRIEDAFPDLLNKYGPESAFFYAQNA